MHAVFFNEKGELIYDFDYEENHNISDDLYPSVPSIYNIDDIDKSTAYLSTCNFFSSAYNYAYETSKDRVPSTLEPDTWYSFSAGQIKSICR